MKNIKLTFAILCFLINLTLIGQPIAEYQPNQLNDKTLTIVDSTLAANHPHNGVFIAYGLSGKPAEQYIYWTNKRTKIPKNDFYILKNHPSPIIRYYAYSEILNSNLKGSKHDFIQHHLKDVEIVRLSSGCVAYQKPVILFFIETHLNNFEKEKISHQIILNPISTRYNKMNQFALEHWDYNEEKYNNIKTSAVEGNMTALIAMIRFKKREDENFIRQKLISLLNSKETRNLALRILYQTHLYDFPSNSVDILIDYHEQAKQNNQLNKVVEDFPEIYTSIVRYKHPKRLIILEELLAITQKPRKVLGFSNRDRFDDFLELKLKIWEDYNILHKVTFEKLRKAFPEKIYPLVKRDLNAMLNGERRNIPCYEKFLYTLLRKNESIEKYMNWALQSKMNNGLAKIALLNLNNHLFSSSKKYVLTMLKSADKIYTCRDILTVLSKYELNRSDKKQIRQWYDTVGKHIEYDKKNRQFDIEICLEKMGIKI